MGKRRGKWYFAWQVILAIGLLIFWAFRATKTRWASRFCILVFGRFIGFIAFQYNRGFRNLFHSKFELREPPNEKINHLDRKFTSSMVNYSIDCFLDENDYSPYNISKTECNESVQRMNYYVHEFQEDNVRSNAVFKMIHVDYFADIEYWLTFMKPLLIFTFVPEGVGGPVAGGSFSVKNDHYHVIHKDGTFIDHMLWDYGRDYITIDTMWGIIVCPIDQYRLIDEPNYRIISLVPATFVPIPFSLMVQKRKINRMKVTFDKQNVLKVTDPTGREYLTLATIGSSQEYIVPYDLFDIIKLRHENSRQSIKTIEAFLKTEGIQKDHIAATLIYDLLKRKSYPPKETEAPVITYCEDVKYRIPRPLKKKKFKFINVLPGPP